MPDKCDRCFRLQGRVFGRLGVVLGLLFLGLQAGCQPAVQTSEEAHHIPAHLPGDFEQALSRLELLIRHLHDGAPLEKMPTEVTVAQELRDIVRWLPELAAESDLSESDWNIVDQATQGVIDSFAKDEQPEKLIGDQRLFSQIASLPQALSEVRERFRELQVTGETAVDDVEPESASSNQ